MEREEIIDKPLCCPFCKSEIISDKDINLSPCEHTLFIITDYGAEYCSELINYEELEKKAHESNWDEAITALEISNSIFIAFYEPAPSFFGVYVGFLNTDKESKP